MFYIGPFFVETLLQKRNQCNDEGADDHDEGPRGWEGRPTIFDTGACRLIQPVDFIRCDRTHGGNNKTHALLDNFDMCVGHERCLPCCWPIWKSPVHTLNSNRTEGGGWKLAIPVALPPTQQSMTESSFFDCVL